MNKFTDAYVMPFVSLISYLWSAMFVPYAVLKQIDVHNPLPPEWQD